MSDKKNKEIAYEDREKLDGELNNAIADILSAEARARTIIERAAASVKAVQLDCATRERDMRAAATVAAAKKKDDDVSDALARGEAEAQRLKATAEKEGEKLLKDKAKTIDALIQELYKSL